MIEVIPAINCLDFACVEAQMRILLSFLPKEGWVHLDVADARFTFNKTWGDPARWREVGGGFNLEVHLMVEEPEARVAEWLRAGAKRVIVHLETVANLDHVAKLCKEGGAELVIATSPETSAERMRQCFGKTSSFQVLAVHPGFAGQKFLPLTMEKVKFLREELPNAHIEVDGGINAETARAAKAAGADRLVAASYIFNNEDPKLAYAMLTQV